MIQRFLLAVCLWTGSLWAAFSQEVIQEHADKVVTVAAHSDSLWIASGSYDNHVIFHDLRDRATTWNKVAHAVAVKDVAFSPDGRLLASAGMDGAVKFWDLPGGRFVKALPPHPAGVYALSFHPSRPWLATGCYDRNVRIFDYQRRQQRLVLPYKGRVNDVAFSPDGQWVAAVTGDPFTAEASNLKMWNAATGEAVFSWQKPVKELRHLAFTPDGKFLIVGGAPTTVFVFRVQDSTLKLLGGLKGFQFGTYALAVDAKGEYMAIGGGFDKKIYIYRLPAFKRIRILEGHQGTIEALAFLPNGQLVSGSIDNTVRLWTIRPPQKAAAGTKTPSPKKKGRKRRHLTRKPRK